MNTLIAAVVLLLSYIAGIAAIAWAASEKRLEIGPWTIVAFCASPLVAAVLLAGTPARPDWRSQACPHCITRNDPSARVCRACGQGM